MANAELVDIQLDVINQVIEYKGSEKVIPENYWKDTLAPYLYPLWDSDKDKLVMFTWCSNGVYLAKRRKYVKDFATNTYSWVDYEMESVDSTEANTLKEKLIESFMLVDSIEEQEFQDEMKRMYSTQNTVSRQTIRLAREFLLDETDWVTLSDCPLSADDKALYATYRTKLRDIPSTPEFTTNVQGTKFPVSPKFYQKVYLPEHTGVAYLSTDDQFLPLADHYLNAFRDKIANYLLLKSFTEKSYFDRMITEYNNTQFKHSPDALALTETEIADRKAFLENIIAKAQESIDNDNKL